MKYFFKKFVLSAIVICLASPILSPISSLSKNQEALCWSHLFILSTQLPPSSSELEYAAEYYLAKNNALAKSTTAYCLLAGAALSTYHKRHGITAALAGISTLLFVSAYQFRKHDVEIEEQAYESYVEWIDELYEQYSNESSVGVIKQLQELLFVCQTSQNPSTRKAFFYRTYLPLYTVTQSAKETKARLLKYGYQLFKLANLLKAHRGMMFEFDIYQAYSKIHPLSKLSVNKSATYFARILQKIPHKTYLGFDMGFIGTSAIALYRALAKSDDAKALADYVDMLTLLADNNLAIPKSTRTSSQYLLKHKDIVKKIVQSTYLPVFQLVGGTDTLARNFLLTLGSHCRTVLTKETRL